MANVPRFRTLRVGRDYISARDWNNLTAAVSRLSKSMGAGGVFDASGLHVRGIRPKRWPPYYKIQSNDAAGIYTLRPQRWIEADQEFADLPDHNDIAGYEINQDDTGEAGNLVEVHIEVSIEGEWVGLFSLPVRLYWGAAYAATPWSAGSNVIMLHPCSDKNGSNEDTDTEITAYVETPWAGGTYGPVGVEVAQNDVLAYLPFGNNDEAVLINPPLRPPPGGDTYMALTKSTDNDYDADWDWVRAHG